MILDALAAKVEDFLHSFFFIVSTCNLCILPTRNNMECCHPANEECDEKYWALCLVQSEVV